MDKSNQNQNAAAQAQSERANESFVAGADRPTVGELHPDTPLSELRVRDLQSLLGSSYAKIVADKQWGKELIMDKEWLYDKNLYPEGNPNWSPRPKLSDPWQDFSSIDRLVLPQLFAAMRSLHAQVAVLQAQVGSLAAVGEAGGIAREQVGG